MKRLEKLLEIASAGLSSKAVDACVAGQSGVALLNSVGPTGFDLIKIHSLRNGFLAFESALWFYSVDASSKYSVESINGLADLKIYAEAMNGGVFFGADALGNQFMVNQQGYWSFDLETAEAEFLAENLEGWAAAVLDDFSYLTGHSLLHEWQLEYGSLQAGMRLTPKTPFILGGEFEVNNLSAVELTEILSFRANLYGQIKDVPPGASVELKLID